MTTVLTGKLSQSQLRDKAMRSAGLDPQLLALKPGTRIQPDKKAASKRGYSKHKKAVSP